MTPSQKSTNSDLDPDEKIDFIKVVASKKEDSNSYTFILNRDAVSKTETQDVCRHTGKTGIKIKRYTVQIVGDEDLLW